MCKVEVYLYIERDKISICFCSDNVLFPKEYMKKVYISAFFFCVKDTAMSVWMVL